MTAPEARTAPSRGRTRPPREARLHWLDAEIRARRFPNAARMARELGIAPRTAWDDCAHLKGYHNAPIDFDPAHDGWYYTDPSFALPFTHLTADEIASLHRVYLAAREFLGEEDVAPLRSLFAQWEEQSRAVSGRHAAVPTVTSTVGREIVSVGGAVLLEGGGASELLRATWRAVRERRKLRLRYNGAHRGTPTERTVQPLHLHNERGEWYLLAHCELRDAVRTFLLARVGDWYAAGEAAAFAVPVEFDALALLQSGFHLKHGESPTAVRIRFDAYQARWIRERRYHESQTIEDLPDGGLILTLRVAGLDEVKRWAMGYGPHAEVLEPESLRREIANDVTRLQTIYGDP